MRYQNVYDKIDAVFRGSEQQNLEYDFRLALEADPNLIQLEFSGTKKMKIDSRGELVLKFKGGELRHRQPIAYQIIDGEKRVIESRFVLLGKNRVGFALGDYDRTKELVIDPIVYATYLGGSNFHDASVDVAVDASGSIYVLTQVGSTDFLNQTRAENRNVDAAVTKLNAAGTAVLYNAYIGGSYNDNPSKIDIDANGNVYFVGQTYSTDFPLRNAFQSSHHIGSGASNGFVVKLDAGGAIAYATYLGGSCSSNNFFLSEEVRNISVDLSGNAYVTGWTCSPDFPLRNALQTSLLSGSMNAFLTKFSNSGQLLYSTYYGGASETRAYSVAADNAGKAYITGSAFAGLPTTAGAYNTADGYGFVAKIDTTQMGSQSLIYSTYIDGIGRAIAVDSAASAYVDNAGYPYQNSNRILKFNAAGSNLVYDSFIAESGKIQEIAVNQNGNLYYTQDTSSPFGDFRIGGLTANGAGSLGTILIGGADIDSGRGMALSPEGLVYVVGVTQSLNFPTTADALQRQSRNVDTLNNRSYPQGFLAKVRLNVEREPLIFVPGTMGSILMGSYLGEPYKYWTNLNINPNYPTTLNLTNNPNSIFYTPGLVATDVLRNIPGLDLVTDEAIIYKPLLDMLQERGGYREYDISRNPTLRHQYGCDLSQRSFDPDLNPSLFVFPYDFRQSDEESAQKLARFVQCVREFYSPETKVNIIAHSQGGLVARRFIMDNYSNHGVRKLITIATPWLGAPEALYKIETGGDYSGFMIVVSPPTIKFLAEYFPSVHQLLPSRTYYDWTTGTFAETGDANANGIYGEVYSYNQALQFLNADFPNTFPGTIGAGFHDYTRNDTNQDDWRNDQSGIEYHHIIAQQYSLNTATTVSVTQEYVCEPRNCNGIRWFKAYRGLGDGTVPTTSASRVKDLGDGTRENINAPNSKRWHLFGQTADEDSLHEHNGITKNPHTHDLVLYLLGLGAFPPYFEPEVEDPANRNLLACGYVTNKGKELLEDDAQLSTQAKVL